MKKVIACVMSLALSCLLLCACGNDRMDNTNPGVTALPNVTDNVLPSVSPDVNDGIVDDKDGIIDDDIIDDDGRNGIADNDSEPSNGVVASPSPSATVNP